MCVQTRALLLPKQLKNNLNNTNNTNNTSKNNK